MTTKIKIEKKREKPQKKWEDSEICAILDYCHQAGNFEKPTAQFFYKKALEETKIDATWDLVKWKMRYLKKSFQKAIEWKNSTGAGLLEAEHGLSNVYAKVLKICPHYERLKEIFADKSNVEAVMAYESSDFNVASNLHFVDDDIDMQPFCDIVELYDESEQYRTGSTTASPPPLPITTIAATALMSPAAATAPTSPPAATAPTSPPATVLKSPAAEKPASEKAARSFAEKLKKSAPKTAIGQLTELQNSRAVLLEKHLEFEKYKFNNERDIQQRRLKIEEERSEREAKRIRLEEDRFEMDFEIENRKLQFEREKFDKEVELKKLKMEADERVAKYEAELKYKKSS